MKLIITNNTTRAVIGGKDNLLGVDLHKELRKYLSMKIQGLEFMRKFAKGRFIGDGYHYFLNKRGDFATGFLPMVVAFASELGAKIEVEDKRVNLPIFKRQPYDFE